jgi:rubrerythrin
LNGARLKKVLAALEGNWQAEMEGHHTYLALADRDTDPVRAQVLRHLAGAEWEHAALWAGRIEELGHPVPVYRGSPGGEADSLANRAGGIRMALRRLEIEESRQIASYGEQLKALGDEDSVAILDHVIEDEKDHYRELGSLLRGHYPPPVGAHRIDAKAVLEEMLAKRSQGRKQPGSWIGDAIYGVNDGLGAIFGIVSGVSGATAGDSKYVLLAGLSGLIASALSMGSGAYLAAKSEREIYHAELARERDAIQMNSPEARELLSLYYQVKGLPEEDAHHMVNHIAPDPNNYSAHWLASVWAPRRRRSPTPWSRPAPEPSLRPSAQPSPSFPSSSCTAWKPSLPPPSSPWPPTSPSAQPRASSPSAPGGLRAWK